MDFIGKTAMVTGSGAIGGLGHAIAKIFVARGATVILTGVDRARGAEVVADLGGDARFLTVDLSSIDEVRRLADEAGPVDILVNNAVAYTMAPTVEQDLDEYDAAFAVNVRAPFVLTATLAPKMVANGGGSIVNISSTAAAKAEPGMTVYSATKAAIEALTRAWAAEFVGGNVRVNAVRPGPMHTSKLVGALGPDLGGLGQAVPMRRSADPSEVAEVVAFVASDKASFMTGATIATDGGRAAI
ncbi:SDR family NAD(P)-dependent oxidoreductase [Solwaraspora sp. WMMD1047]|uniref:SDR family NAD(P)-dependent oxidoreductase n=1 Tax=Solwaraspora sp. WMMD1047 TaxID=3016102 RepID=UPI002415E5F3|nr:SDR family oxidoreductase [Solwaraspora sp. WMMD1047]MDG4833224.1 SDR family NAD(P)-dependent oxidoreductase [Solwaraspora sp. WMMD1047]